MKSKTELLADFDRVTAERDALQVRLTEADERADVLEGLLREAVKTPWLYDVRGKIMAALKPAECDHSYHHFGTEQPRRRCNLCNKLEPAEGRGDDRPNGCCCPPKGFTGLWAGASCPIHQGLRAIKP